MWAYCGGFSCGRTKALACAGSVIVGLGAPWHMEFSWSRYQICDPCIGKRILNHFPREVTSGYFIYIIFLDIFPKVLCPISVWFVALYCWCKTVFLGSPTAIILKILFFRSHLFLETSKKYVFSFQGCGKIVLGRTAFPSYEV